MPVALVLPLRNGGTWFGIASPLRPPATGVPAIVARPPMPLPTIDEIGLPPPTLVGSGAQPTVVPVHGVLPPKGSSFADGTAVAAAASALSMTGPAGVPVWAWVAIIVLVLFLLR